MDQGSNSIRERRTRKSISDIGDRQMSPLRLNLNSENPLEGALQFVTNSNREYNREYKRSIIKINKRKLPVDFFSHELPEQIVKRGYEKRASMNNGEVGAGNRVNIERRGGGGSQRGQQDDVQDDRFKATSSFGLYNNNASQGPQQPRHSNHFLNSPQQQSPPRFHSHPRKNQTRSEQKRQKPIFQQRKFTAAPVSSKPDALDLFALQRERLEESNDAVVFPGTFARDLREMRELPSRSMALREGARLRERIDKRVDLENIRLDVLNMRGGEKKTYPEMISPRKSSSTSPTKPQITSPTRKQLKKQPTHLAPSSSISPVKIIVTSTQPLPPSNPSNQFFDVTFYNSKSSVLPPISK